MATVRLVGLLVLAAFAAACEQKPKPASLATPSAPPATASAVAAASAPAPDEEEEEEGEPTEIAAQHILVAYRGAKNAPRSVTRTKAEAKQRAEEVLVEARAKQKTFADLAAEYSDDPTKSSLGNLGKFPKDKMVPAFSEPAFKLKVNQISEVVETEFGFHIIKRNQ